MFRGDHSQGVINTFSQDLEPESVAISADDRYAFISLQVGIIFHISFLNCLIVYTYIYH